MSPTPFPAPTLEGIHIRMEPVGEQHYADLVEAASFGGFDFMPTWEPPKVPADFGAFLEQNQREFASMSLAIVCKESGKAIGSSSFLDIRLAHRSLEIGATWITERLRGSHVNPEIKLLMLGFAFDELGCIRVQLKTDGRNVRSQRAMEKLGCTKEGVLRRHSILPDGYVRDNVMYSILDTEWPQVRQGLLVRLDRAKSAV